MNYKKDTACRHKRVNMLIYSSAIVAILGIGSFYQSYSSLATDSNEYMDIRAQLYDLDQSLMSLKSNGPI